MTDFKIYYYITPGGSNPVRKFIDSLDIRTKSKVHNLFELLKIYKTFLGFPHAKKVNQTELWELRTTGKKQVRIFYAKYARQGFVILHGFIKKTQKIPLKHLKIAQRRLKIWRNLD